MMTEFSFLVDYPFNLTKNSDRNAQWQLKRADIPRLDLVLDLSMMALLLGLFSTDLLAKEISAVTLVIDILQLGNKYGEIYHIDKKGIQNPQHIKSCLSPAFKPVFQKVKECFLHHICHLCSKPWGQESEHNEQKEIFIWKIYFNNI